MQKYKSEVKKTQCTAKVVAYSFNEESQEPIITYELEYPRLIHSELMTHRLFSRNAASSRAIPVKSIIEQTRFDPAKPVRFGQNQSGMQDKGCDHKGRVIIYHDNGSESYLSANEAWSHAAHEVSNIANAFSEAGYHKQICNRLIEPFQYIKTVVTFTGNGNNFFGLRNHPDADPTICELAQAMYEARELASTQVLKAGDWHMPYWKDGYFIKGEHKGLEKAKKVSASCCAQVSYRKLDDSEEKADLVFDRLVNSKPVHASPTEHQAAALKRRVGFKSKYVTAVDREGNTWSGNFRNWGQFRQEIPFNVIKD